MNELTCIWQFNHDLQHWETGCHRTNVIALDVEYCPYCGKLIVWK